MLNGLYDVLQNVILHLFYFLENIFLNRILNLYVVFYFLVFEVEI